MKNSDVLVVRMIAAMDADGVIGVEDAQGHQRMPWHLPGDLKWFKEQTQGAILVVGRRTYDTLTRPLVNRRIAVLSRQAAPLNPTVPFDAWLPSADAFAELADRWARDAHARGAGCPPVWVIGGAQVYDDFLAEDMISEAFITRVVRPDAPSAENPLTYREPAPAASTVALANGEKTISLNPTIFSEALVKVEDRQHPYVAPELATLERYVRRMHLPSGAQPVSLP